MFLASEEEFYVIQSISFTDRLGNFGMCFLKSQSASSDESSPHSKLVPKVAQTFITPLLLQDQVVRFSVNGPLPSISAVATVMSHWRGWISVQNRDIAISYFGDTLQGAAKPIKETSLQALKSFPLSDHSLTRSKSFEPYSIS